MSTSDFSRRSALTMGVALPFLPRFAAASSAEPVADGEGTIATIRTTQFGEYKVTSVQDGSMLMPPGKSPFAAKTTTARLEGILRDNMLRTDMVSLDINVVIFQKGKDVLLIDGGTGAKLIPALKQLGITPEMVGAIALTHAHGDHYGGLITPDGKSAFPNATILTPEPEYAFWTSAMPQMPKSLSDQRGRDGAIAGAQRAFGILKKQILTVEGEKEWGTGFSFIPMPGHTPGHAGVRVTSGKEQLVHFADLCHHFAIIVQNPEIQVQFDTDPIASIDMRKKMFDRFAADKVRIVGSHMPFPGFGHLTKRGGKFRWEIEPWVQ